MNFSHEIWRLRIQHHSQLYTFLTALSLLSVYSDNISDTY